MTSENKDAHSKLALVVDDAEAQCKVLRALLKDEGYRVFTANDGARGIAMFIKYSPDLVIMDVNMPVMDGFECARQIKALSKDTLTPIVFVTSLDNEQTYIDSLDSGGDGILVRPFTPGIFKAKINAIQRISNLYQKVKILQTTQQHDAELAEQLFSRVIESRNYGMDRVGMIKKPAELFSGDIQLTALCPNGDINVMLGDFTGHGLRSSIGAIPLAETFRAMTQKGYSLLTIINQINTLLYDLLPADLFLAGVFATVSSHEQSAYIFNAGLPDGYLLNNLGSVKECIASQHPPIGVLPNLLVSARLQVMSIELTDHLIMISDGIIEARNSEGEMYGEERLAHALYEGMKAEDISSVVEKSIQQFCLDTPQQDDISLIDLPCGGWDLPTIISNENDKPTLVSLHSPDQAPLWCWSLTLSNERLAKVNPVPLVMNQLQEIEGKKDHWLSFYTVITELYVNAFDHGVLGLNSDLKNLAEGFAEYFKEKEKRINRLDDGFIEINLKFYELEQGGKIVLTIKDSGEGFDYIKFLEKFNDQNQAQLSGRGLYLVKQLCETLNYHENGTLVEASYIWQ